jgi:probable phosphoglycerate mutase
MTSILLVRHAAHDWLGKGLAGRLGGVGLNESGLGQAQALARRLDDTPVDAVYSSPQQRALETAAPLCARRGFKAVVEPGVDEIDFGRWTGMGFEELAREPLWQTWVERRGSATPPGGEPFGAVAQRAREALDRLVLQHPEQSVLVVSHGDVIKALLAGFLGMSLDHLERFEIAPASLSVVAAGPGWSQVRLVNGPTS